jgi:hypothetical protein
MDVSLESVPRKCLLYGVPRLYNEDKDVSPEAEKRSPLEPLPSNVTENTGLGAMICKCSHELYY